MGLGAMRFGAKNAKERNKVSRIKDRVIRRILTVGSGYNPNVLWLPYMCYKFYMYIQYVSNGSKSKFYSVQRHFFASLYVSFHHELFSSIIVIALTQLMNALIAKGI